MRYLNDTEIFSNSKSVGEFFKAKRITDDLSVDNLAELSGISRVYLYNFESGRQTNMGIEKLIQLAYILDIEIFPEIPKK